MTPCPKTPAEFAAVAGSGAHLMKLDRNDGRGREIWRCQWCGQIEIRAQPFR